MGAHASNFLTEDKSLPKNLKPANPQWIFKHAEVCGMPFAEVLRCWRRFSQMGINKKGLLSQTSIVWKSEDKFVQQILRQLPWSNKTTLSFQVYLKACKWFAGIDEITKLKVIYAIINRGQPIDNITMQRVLKHVYPDKNVDELSETTSEFMLQIGYKKTGTIDEEEFVDFAKQIPFEEMSKILHIDIIPNELHYSSTNE